MSSLSTRRSLPSAVRRIFAPSYTPGILAPILPSAAISAVTVAVCCLAFGPQLGLISMLGAMTPYWETGRPLWARIRNSMLVSVALSACMAVGVLVAPFSWAIVPATVAVVLVAGVLYYAFMLTAGPSPVMMFYAAAIGTFFGADQELGWRMVGVTAFASAMASILLLVPLLFDPRGPERRAVEAARKAVDTYENPAGACDRTDRLARNNAFDAVSNAWLTVESAWPADRGHRYRELAAQLRQIDADLTWAAFADAGEDATGRSPATKSAQGRPGWRFLLARALRVDSVEWFTAWRMGLAAAIAGYLSQAAGIGHPYWAILTATVVVNLWRDRLATTERAVHRSVGTLIGVAIAWAVWSLHPSPWWTVVAVIVCMVGQYLTFPMNYTLALIWITPMALLASEGSGAGGTVGSLISDRVTDTLLGAATAVAVTWATSWFFPSRLVRSQSARSAAAIEAMDRAVEQGEQFSTAGLRSYTVLRYELTHHQSILDRAVGDDPRLADWMAEEQRVADRGYAALAHARTVVVPTASEHARSQSEDLPPLRA